MERRVLLLAAAAIPLGFAGGYAWSVRTAVGPSAYVPPRAATADMPASPEELPEASDQLWASRAGDTPPSAAAGSASADPTVRYSGCNEVRAAGKAPLYAGQPGYRAEMDGDDDGIACEPIRQR